MPKQQLASVIQDVDEQSFHARYLKIPAVDKPAGCLLPTLLAPPPDPPQVNEPSVVKDCSYNWIEEVIPLVPFVPPFPCPDGFHLDTIQLDILPLPDHDAVDLLSLDLRRKLDEKGARDICRYELVGTDEIVIPCYPNGPVIESTATVSVFYEETKTQQVTKLTMDRDTDYPCKWSLDGDVSVVVPKVPCSLGIMFLDGNWGIRGSAPDPYGTDANEDLIPKMTGATTPYGTAAASSALLTNYGWKAMDDTINASALWVASGPAPQWISYDFGSPQTVRSYTLRVWLDGLHFPTSWEMQHSSDGSSWTTLHTRSGVSWSFLEKKSFNVPETTARYWRVYVTACGSSHNCTIAEWELRGAGPTEHLVPEETKRVEVTKRTGFDCIYDIEMPELIIPCYPNGPKVHGRASIVITDRGTPKSIQTLGFDERSTPSCDFEFTGQITLPSGATVDVDVLNIDIPCQTGLTIPTKTFKIISTGPSVEPDTEMELKLVKDPANICHYNFEFPDLEIPCYPDGPTFSGAVEVLIGRDPLRTSVKEITIGANNGATCQFDLQVRDVASGVVGGDIVIPLPNFAIDCDSLNFRGGIRVKQNANAPWLTNNISLVNEACGAVLSGDLNLDLPNFVVNCPTMKFGGAIAVRTFTNGAPGPALPSTVTLARTECGADITGEILLNIPAFNFPCPNGYTASLQGPTIRMNGNLVNHTLKISRVIDPLNSPGGNQCAFRLDGELNLTAGGGGGGGVGFNYIPDWTAGQAISIGSVVGIVGHEGGRCTYCAIRNIGTNEPPPLGESSAWRCIGCEEGGKRYHPFKVIQCPGTNATVKVVVDSKLSDGKELRPILGLDTPFTIAPEDSIWLEVIWDFGAEPTFLYAGIARGPAWDVDHDFGSLVVQPSIWNPVEGEADAVKLLQPAAFGAAFDEPKIKDYLFKTFKRWAINTADPLNDAHYTDAGPTGLEVTNDLLYWAITDTKEMLQNLFNDRNRVANGGRLIKSYIMIAETKSVDCNSGSDLELPAPGDKTFGLIQKLKWHVVDIGATKNNRVTRVLRVGGNPKNKGKLELAIPQISPPVGTPVNFDVVGIPATATPITVGIKPDDVHIYYTTGASRELKEPTYDTFKVSEAKLYDPKIPLFRPADQELHIRAVAFHPLMQTSQVIVRSYTE